MQSVGKSILGAFISFSKQVLIQIPAMYLLAPKHGVIGILWSGPISDVVSCLFAVVILLFTAKDIFKKPHHTEEIKAEESL